MTVSEISDEVFDDGRIPLPLTVLVCLSVCVHAVLLAVYWLSVTLSSDRDIPTDRAWNWYLLVGATWSVGIGSFGLYWGSRATTRFGGRGSSARAGWCLAGVWTGFFWPVPMAAALVVLATRPQRLSRADQIQSEPVGVTARRLRIAARAATAVVALVVAFAGSVWGWRAHAARLHEVAGASATSVVGTWSSGDMTVTLHPDGTYDASDLTAADWADSSFPPGTGTWGLSVSNDGADSVELRPSADRLLELPVYRAASIDYLCAETDPDSPCHLVFHRS
jgi:hypothetical protein